MNSKHKHCAIFLPSLPVGGAEQMALNIATGLFDENYSVDLVLVKAEGEFIKKVPEHVNLVDFNSSRVITSLPYLIKYLRKKQPDVLLSTITPTNVIAAWATSLPGINTKHVVRVARPETVAAKIQNNTIKQRLTARFARLSYPLSDKFIAISNGVANDLYTNTRIRQQDIHVIYNPTVTTEMLEKAKEPVDHPWFNNNVPVVLGVGRFVDQKDFGTLIKSFSTLLNKQEAQLIIFGDGNKRDALEQLIEELGISQSVDLPGFTSNPYKYMANADVFVNSAIHEGFGNVIIEAMACGCPVVATDCPGAPAELLDNGTYGHLVPVSNPDAMANSVNDMLNNPTGSEDLRNRASHFSIETIIKSYSEVLQEACKT